MSSPFRKFVQQDSTVVQVCQPEIYFRLFYQHQSLYIAPAVQKYWDTMRANLLEERKNKEILLSSDARNYSRGHCAQYCTYTLADMVDEVILQQNIIAVREVEGRKSTNMERLGFERGMDTLLSTDVVIKEVITDEHTGIAALMSMKFVYVILYIQLLLVYCFKDQQHTSKLDDWLHIFICSCFVYRLFL